MIYVTGDTHGEFKGRFNTANFPEQREMTKDDYVIICGDFGGVWDVGWESKNEKYWLDWLEERSFTLLDYYRFDYETYYTRHCAELLLAKDVKLLDMVCKNY